MSPKPQGFPPDRRLKTPAEFDAVFSRKSSAGDGNLVVYVARNTLGHNRMGLVVSRRKIGNAVQRNRWKRRLREAFRLQQEKFPQGFDLVVLPQSKAHPGFAELQQALLDLAHRAARKWRRNHSQERPPR